ncbi:hypothetical protein K3757_08690 [Sulfitobacter sp. S223]|uniref:hypothetical protein n=1 Tax=Sulfitobacter sp. S223 TaxID=2867023 RepID=UPI0021A5A3DC|nr:hypothetical protein [Sulfitobacter sp. S223]UWR27995.1 hypothetical protein K3757_08690 [Sulfitobacter sp. S223]
MTPTDVEAVYDALAAQIDSVGPEKSELFLIKLALLLSHEFGDANRVIKLIYDAKRNLDAANYR